METQWSVGGCLEIRQRGGGRSLSGSFLYGRTATVRDRGRVRKETFRLGAFSWQIRAFAETLKDLNAALAEVGDEALEATRDSELSLEQRRANEPERISELRQELERRNIHILSGHSFGRPLGSLLTGNARVTDDDDAVRFEVDLPDEARQPSWMRDAVLAVEAGLSVGVSPGFSVPPADVIPNAEELVPEPGNPGVSIRAINAAVLYELSIVTRPSYGDTEVDLRADELLAADPILREIKPGVGTLWL